MAEFASGGTSGVLPEQMPDAQRLLDLYDVWVFWQATGKRFLPSQLLKSESLDELTGILKLDGLFATMREALEDEEDTDNG